MSFTTPLGCTISVVPAPEHLGDGVLLVLDMKQAGDGRHAEVYLDWMAVTELSDALAHIQ